MYVFGFPDEMFYELNICLNSMCDICLESLELFCISIACFQMFQIERWEEQIQCVTPLYASIKGLIINSNVYVCSLSVY